MTLFHRALSKLAIFMCAFLGFAFQGCQSATIVPPPRAGLEPAPADLAQAAERLGPPVMSLVDTSAVHCTRQDVIHRLSGDKNTKVMPERFRGAQYDSFYACAVVPDHGVGVGVFPARLALIKGTGSPPRVIGFMRKNDEIRCWETSVDSPPGSGHAWMMERIGVIGDAGLIVCGFSLDTVFLASDDGRVVAWDSGPNSGATSIQSCKIEGKRLIRIIDDEAAGPWLIYVPESAKSK